MLICLSILKFTHVIGRESHNEDKHKKPPREFHNRPPGILIASPKRNGHVPRNPESLQEKNEGREEEEAQHVASP